MDPTSVLVVDDHAMLADSIATSLTRLGMPSVACGPPGSAVVQTALELKPTVILVDLALGDEDGTDLIRALQNTGAQVLAVSGTADRSHFGEALAAGAHGYVPKSAPFEELVSAIRSAAAGEPLLSPSHRSELISEAATARAERATALHLLAKLTQAERRVLDLLAAGWAVAEIASELFVSMGTVRAQIRAIHSKLEVHHQLAAVAILHAVR